MFPVYWASVRLGHLAASSRLASGCPNRNYIPGKTGKFWKAD